MLSCFNSVGKLGSTEEEYSGGGNLICLGRDKVILHYMVYATYWSGSWEYELLQHFTMQSTIAFDNF